MRSKLAVAAHSVRYLLFDGWVSQLFGVIGYLMRKFGYPLAPVVLVVILSQQLEIALKQSLALSRGSYLIFFNRPIALAFMLLAFGAIARAVAPVSQPPTRIRGGRPGLGGKGMPLCLGAFVAESCLQTM
jgi:putative tricarboxylic transport membrane protein